VAPVAAEAEPALQGVQTEADCAPAPAVEYVPAGQDVQAEFPVPCAYLPAAHTVHEPSEPVAATLPAAQGVQAERPAVAATEPAAHGVQLVEPAKVLTEPTAQLVHEAALDAPTTEDAVPALHATQTLEDVALAPVLVEKVPATQLVHVVEPAAAHVPATQATQAEALPAPSVAEAKPAAQGAQVAEEVAPVAVE